MEHQICQFHVRRWAERTLRELSKILPKDWLWVLEEVKNLLAELSPAGSRWLFELWKQIPDCRAGQDVLLPLLDQLRYLLFRLSEHWDGYRVFTWQNGVQWYRTGHWTHENACSHGARLQILAGDAGWTPAEWNRFGLVNLGASWEDCASSNFAISPTASVTNTVSHGFLKNGNVAAWQSPGRPMDCFTRQITPGSQRHSNRQENVGKP